jgi:hypothetical protein
LPYADKKKQAAFQKAHYEANRTLYRARAKAGRQKAKEAIRRFLRDYLIDHPCVDCGESNLIVLEFDHRAEFEKVLELGIAIRQKWSIARLKTEIEKCDVRCANCHRKKTYLERGFTHRDSDW